MYRYFINVHDQIKMIADPEQDFQFKINTNDRYNELQAEAMNSELLALLGTHSGYLGLTHIVLAQLVSVRQS